MNKHAEHAGHKSEIQEETGTLVEQGKELAGHVRDQALTRIKAMHKVVHENPYRAVAVAAGVGAILGFFLARRGGCQKDD